MESNNPNLGNDVTEDNLTPDTEQTIADVQEAAEQPVEETLQAELIEDAEPQAETEQVEVEEMAVEESVSEDVLDIAEPEADPIPEVADDAAAVEASVSEDVPDITEPEADPIPEVADDAAAVEASVSEDVPDITEPEVAPVVEAADDAAEVEALVSEDVPDITEPEAAPVVEAADDAAEESVEEEARFRKNEVIDGIVAETSPTEVLIDLGEGVIGVVASRELERMDRDALEALEIGNTVSAFILKVRGAGGRPVLSLARAEEENNWRMAEEYYTTKQVYFSKVAGYNKGGLIVRFGKVRGFVPASQVSHERQSHASGSSPEERWGSMVGDDIAVKVVEIDRARNRLILSERAAAREWRERQKARLIEELAEGDVRTGRVISVADFGAFVDLGGADGLVHLTEISWQHITHPRDVLEVGQEVEVQVINIDRDRKRIGLSMKRRENDPWGEILKNYTIGQLVQASVTKLTKFGAFARLVDSPEIEGLVHISELADYRVSHPKEVVLVGDVLTLRIVKISPDQRRLGLSLRQVDSARYMDQDWQAVYDEIEETEDLDVTDDD